MYYRSVTLILVLVMVQSWYGALPTQKQLLNYRVISRVTY